MSEVYGGYRWRQQTKEHLQDPRFLERDGYKVYSQNDEDGILQEIGNKIPDNGIGRLSGQLIGRPILRC